MHINNYVILYSYRTISKICKYHKKTKVKSKHICSIEHLINENIHANRHAKPIFFKHDDFNIIRRKIYIKKKIKQKHMQNFKK